MIDAKHQCVVIFIEYLPVYRLVYENYLVRKGLGFCVAFVRVLAGFEVQVFLNGHAYRFLILEIKF